MEEAKKQELIMRASLLQRQAEEIEQHLQLLTREMQELQIFKEHLKQIDKSPESLMYASLGKGIFSFGEMKSKELLVDVGAGVLVKKTPAQTCEVINIQISKMTQTRKSLLGKLEIYQKLLHELVEEARTLEYGHEGHVHRH